jgi:hypothetical protein
MILAGVERDKKIAELKGEWLHAPNSIDEVCPKGS